MTINVGIEFQVSRSREISQATKRLVGLGTATKAYANEYDLLSAARNRDLSAQKKYAAKEKELLLIQKKSKLSHQALGALVQKHTGMLRQYRRELDENVKTDKRALKLAKEQEKQDLALVKSKAKLKAEHLAVRESYDHLAKATRLFEAKQVAIEAAFDGIEDGGVGAAKALDMLTKEYLEFVAASKSGGVVDAGNQFARYGDQAYRAAQRTKRFASVGLQQAGYQVNDFIVQIASGQNALVAFGQQGSQLAGIFGPAGAVVGALIAGASAVANLVYQSYKGVKAAKELEESWSSLEEVLGKVADTGSQLDSIVGAPFSKVKEGLLQILEVQKQIQFKSLSDSLKTSFGQMERDTTDFTAWMGSILNWTEAQLIDKFPGMELTREQIKNLNEGVSMVGNIEADGPLGKLLKHSDTLNEQLTTAQDKLKKLQLPTIEFKNGSHTVTKADIDYNQTMPLQDDIFKFEEQKKAIDQMILAMLELQDMSIVDEASIDKAATKMQDLVNMFKPGAAISGELLKIYEETGLQDWVVKLVLATKEAQEEEKKLEASYKGLMRGLDGFYNGEVASLKVLTEEQKISADTEKERLAFIKEFANAGHELAQQDLKAINAAFFQLDIDRQGALIAARVAVAKAAADKAAETARQQAEALRLREIAQQGKLLLSTKEQTRLAKEGVRIQELKLAELGLASDYEAVLTDAQNKQVALAGEKVRLRLSEKFAIQGTTDAEYEAHDAAVAVAEAFETAKIQLQEAATAARNIATALNNIDRIDIKIADFGKNLRSKIAVVKAEIEALRTGEDPGIAKTILTIQQQAAELKLEREELTSEALDLPGLNIHDRNDLREYLTSGNEARVIEIDFELGNLDDYEAALKRKKKLEAELRKKPPKAVKVKDPLGDLEKELIFKHSLLGVDEDRQKVLKKIQKEMSEDPTKYTQEQIDAVVELAKGVREAAEAYLEYAGAVRLFGTEMVIVRVTVEELNAVASSVADSFGDAFTSMVDGTKSVKSAFKDMARAIVEDLWDIFVIKRMTGFIESSIRGVFDDQGTLQVNPMAKGNVFSQGNVDQYAKGGVVDPYSNVVPFSTGGVFSSPVEPFSTGGVVDSHVKKVLPFAKGGVFSSPVEPFATGGVVNSHVKKVLPFAKGGVFSSPVEPFATGGVVNSPTYFPMNEGKVGLMGEAGPEAIMPLERGADGKLGVQAHGNGSSNVVIHQNFNFTANGDDSVKRIIAQAAPQIAQMTKSSLVNDRRRGGQMKATFG